MMPAEPLPPEVADRLERSRHQPGAMMLAWAKGPGPALLEVREQLAEALTERTGDRRASGVMYLELIGTRARRFLADLRPCLSSDHAQRYAVDHVDAHLAMEGGRVIVAAVMLHR